MNMLMLKQVMTEPGKIIFKTCPVPEPREDEVLIKILRIGVCGSDVHVNHGIHPFTSYPVTQGHEISGVIAKKGSSVSDFIEGDLVTIQPQIVCGACYPCTHDNYHICDELKVMGFQAPGMAAEYFCTNADRVIKLPEGMTPEEGAMVEPVAVGCHALGRSIDVRNKKIVVLGAGPIGNLTAQTARGLGAASVMITDVSDYRLEIAKKTGIDYTVNPTKRDLNQEIERCFGAEKADLILDCVGVQATIDSAVNCARKGTDIIIVGVFGKKAKVDLSLVQDRELRLIGTAMYQEKDYYTAIELIQNGSVMLEPLMTTHFPFAEYAKAYTFLDTKKDAALKIFIDVDK